MQAVLGVLLVLCGCGAPEDAPPRDAVQRYFAENNAAARRGPAAQRAFLARTQHPDFADQLCDLNGSTVQLDPALSTLRPDPDFTPDGTPVRGEVWVVGVEVTVRQGGQITGHQVGSQHLVLLDEQVRGFAPCPS